MSGQLAKLSATPWSCSVHAVICGAGLDGLVLAAQLGRAGWEVLLIHDELNDNAAPFLVELNSESLYALEQLGVLPEFRNAAERVSRMRWCDLRGREIASAMLEDRRLGGADVCQRIQRERLEAILRQQLPPTVKVTTDTVVTEVTSRPGSVEITLSDGTRVQTDLLLAADGVPSRVRDLVFGTEGLWSRPLGYHSAEFVFEDARIRGLLADEVAILSAPGRRVALWPLRGRLIGATFTFRTASSIRPKTPATWLKFVFGDMQWCIPSVLEHAQRATRLHYHRATLFKSTVWNRDRVALLGDACHAYSVLPGQGCSATIAAAFSLGSELLKPGALDVSFLNYEAHLIREVAARRHNARRMRLWHIPDSRRELVLRNGLLRLSSLPGLRRLITPALTLAS